MDYVDWFQGDRSHFVQDADSILDTFDAACHAAGPERCALWVDDGGAAGVGRRRARILESLKTSPVLIPAGATPSGPRLPVVVTYSFLQALTRMLLYKPLVHAPGMAAIYAGLERGDGLPYYRMVLYMTGRRRGDDDNGPEGSDDDDASDLLCPLSDTPVTEPLETLMEPDAFPAIMCSDGVPVTDTPAEFADYLDRMLGLSRWAGAACINFRVVCVGRTERPDWRFAIGAGDEAVVTAQPILFVNNLQDNVTPLQSAHNNSAHFPGSVVLQQNSLGVSCRLFKKHIQ